MELAGEVAELGPGISRFAVGDRVMAIVGGGAQAELCLVPERTLMAVPDGVDWPAAGGLPEVFTTAHDALFSQCGLQVGERLLVHGAAGGVGTAAVQLGVAAGARVHATVRNEAHRDAVAALGATVHRARGLRRARPLRRDPRAGRRAQPRRQPAGARARGGASRSSASARARRTEIDLRALMGRRGRIHGSTLRARSLEEKAMTARALERTCCRCFERGALHVPVAATFPLAEVADAYARFAAGGKLGKIVVLDWRLGAAVRDGMHPAGDRCMHRSRAWRMRHTPPNTAAAPRTSRRARGRTPRTPASRVPRRARGRCWGRAAARSAA